MHEPSGYTLRVPAPDDFQAVVDVVVASELARTGRSTLGADFVGGEWHAPGFHLDTDARIAADGTGTVVGYAQAVFEEPNVVDSWGVVHPDHRGRGLGTTLFDWIEQRARELLDGIDAPVFRHKTDAGDEGAESILRSRRLQPVRHFRHMQIDLANHADAADVTGAVSRARSAPLPPGVAVTGIDPDKDLRTVHAIIDEALAEHWGERSTDFESWIEEQRAEPGYAPDLWLLATYEGAPAGALTMSRSDDGAWIDYLGMLAPYRGHGIAGALLRRSLAASADLGLPRVLVSVDADNASGATAVYERAGMRVVAGWDVWERS